VSGLVVVECGNVWSRAAVWEACGDDLRLLHREQVLSVGRGALRAALGELFRRVGVDHRCPRVGVVKAHGALRAAVSGVIRDISADSAIRAAYRAGARVVETFAVDDQRSPHQRARLLKSSTIDLLVMAGGVDEGLLEGGGGQQVVQMARVLAEALPPARFDGGMPVPVVFAGSAQLRDEVTRVLGERTQVRVVDNVRPAMERENPEPLQNALLEFFRQQVVPRDPCYRALAEAGIQHVSPLGYPLGLFCRHLATERGEDVLLVDAGAESVDVYSVIKGNLNRSTYAWDTDQQGLPLDMGEVERAARWLPFPADAEAVADVLANARLRPCTVPGNQDEGLLRDALLREQLARALQLHSRVARELKGIQRRRTISEILGAYQVVGGQTLVDMMRIRSVVLTGGALARPEAAGAVCLSVLDGLQPTGITHLWMDADDILGLLSGLYLTDWSARAARNPSRWLRSMGTVVAPKTKSGWWQTLLGGALGRVTLETPEGTVRRVVRFGELVTVPLREGETAILRVRPAPGVDFGSGPGQPHTDLVLGGLVGVVLDGRGRPLLLPTSPEQRREDARKWMSSLAAYSDQVISKRRWTG